MQTFLPYPEFERTARILDRQRLGKQRVEVLQLLQTLLQNKAAWRNHPAARMWATYEVMLSVYGDVICEEWVSRGYKDTCRDKIRALRPPTPLRVPPWLGVEAFHQAHKSNLLRKDPVHYGKFGWDVPSDLPYIWPVDDVQRKEP